MSYRTSTYQSNTLYTLFQAKEEELRELQNQNMFLQLEVTQLRSHVNSCYETSESMVQEVRNKHVSRVFVREETEHLKNLKGQVKDIQGQSVSSRTV